MYMLHVYVYMLYMYVYTCTCKMYSAHMHMKNVFCTCTMYVHTIHVILHVCTLSSFSSRRISLRKDTCCIVAISLNMSEWVNPVIWHAHSLPYDCCYTVPVARPIGQLYIASLSLSLCSVYDVIFQYLPNCSFEIH